MTQNLEELLADWPEPSDEEMAKRALDKEEQERVLANQRVERGWDETAYWDTGWWIAKHLGEILVYTGDNLHGMPPGVPFEEWQLQHYRAGLALTRWVEARDDYSGKYTQEQHADIYTDAQAAMGWVADNLAKLWD